MRDFICSGPNDTLVEGCSFGDLNRGLAKVESCSLEWFGFVVPEDEARRCCSIFYRSSKSSLKWSGGRGGGTRDKDGG